MKIYFGLLSLTLPPPKKIFYACLSEFEYYREALENESHVAEMVGRLLFKNLVNETLIVNLLGIKCSLIAP